MCVSFRGCGERLHAGSSAYSTCGYPRSPASPPANHPPSFCRCVLVASPHTVPSPIPRSNCRRATGRTGSPDPPLGSSVGRSAGVDLLNKQRGISLLGRYSDATTLPSLLMVVRDKLFHPSYTEWSSCFSVGTRWRQQIRDKMSEGMNSHNIKCVVTN